MKLFYGWDLYFRIRNTKMIKDWGLANSLWDHVISSYVWIFIFDTERAQVYSGLAGS